ncbi:MAG TPA: ABC transporter ATP-binding protein [Thermodesulfobacteriota bacterium]
MASITIRGLSKRYAGAGVAAVRRLDLDVAAGEFVTLLGPSGCGKTTTLRLIAGFITPDDGEIRVGGAMVSSGSGCVPPERRGMGMVFQNYAVWPHKTVFENVAFGLQVRKVPRPERARRVAQVLELVGLTGLEGRYPGQLSGGQQQRVALARSLVVEPQILLLDEPLSNLDAKLRERMRWELKALQRRTGITFVYVTHDQSEAMALSDRIAVMHEGTLEQYDTPREVYARPATRTVADFMGLVNFLPGRVRERRGDAGVVLVGGAHPLELPLPPPVRAGQEVQLAVRPENVRIAGRAGVAPDAIPATVAELAYLGNLNDYQVALADGTRLRVQSHPRERFEPGEAVGLTVDTASVSVFV